MQNTDVESFGGGGGHQLVGYLAPTLTAPGEQPLYLQRPSYVRSRSLDRIEGVQGCDKVIPLCGSACGVSDF
ncbi:MAG: hypothetical protein ABJC62_05120 [Frankiaceae bacterium]